MAARPGTAAQEQQRDQQHSLLRWEGNGFSVKWPLSLNQRPACPMKRPVWLSQEDTGYMPPPSPPGLPMEKLSRDTKQFPGPYPGPRLQMRIDVRLRNRNGLITAIILEHPSLLSSPFTSDWLSIVPHSQCLFEELCSVCRYKRICNFFPLEVTVYI